MPETSTQIKWREFNRLETLRSMPVHLANATDTPGTDA